jgi:hypothetical protein
MPPVIMHNTIQLTMSGENDGREFIHVWCYRTTGAPTNSQVISVAQWALTDLLPQLRVMNSPHVIWNSATAKSMDAANGYQYVQPITTNNTGTRGQNEAPANAAAVVNWKTAQSGRSFSGKTFLGAFDASDVLNSILQGVIMQLLTAFCNWLLSHQPAAGVVLAVGSRKLQGSTPVTGFILDNTVDDIGRRLIGHGG